VLARMLVVVVVVVVVVGFGGVGLVKDDLLDWTRMLE